MVIMKVADSLFTNRERAMLSTMKVILKEMLNNVQVLEWEKVAEDWIRAGRHLMLLHYEEVTNVLSNIGFAVLCWALEQKTNQYHTCPNYLNAKIGGQRPCEFDEGHPEVSQTSS